MWQRFKAVFQDHPALIIGAVILVALLFYVMMKPSSAPGTTAVNTGPSDAAVQANAAETLAQIQQQGNADNNATAVGVASINAGAATTIAQLQSAAATSDSNNQLAAILASVQGALGIAQSTNAAAVTINDSNNTAAMHINDTNADVGQTLGLATIGLSSHEADLSNQLANASLNSNTPITISQSGDSWGANIGTSANIPPPPVTPAKPGPTGPIIDPQNPENHSSAPSQSGGGAFLNGSYVASVPGLAATQQYGFGGSPMGNALSNLLAQFPGSSYDASGNLILNQPHGMDQ